jgi:predicted enzyme related to lactoylglutathione lyase
MAFYRELFGWRIGPVEGYENYWYIQTGDEEDLSGGLFKREMPEQGQVNYVQVESVAEYAAKVEELGGMVIIPKTVVPGMGWYAQFVDPEGNVFAMWETDRSAS